jgi:hypothetical protein
MSSLESVGAISNASSQATHFANPPGQLHGGQDISMSDMARGMLSSITDLQNGFQQDVAPATQDVDAINAVQSNGPTESAGAEPISDAAKILADQIEQSTQVQQQLTRFVMASSVSSSLGKNLNMFLRGQ